MPDLTKCSNSSCQARAMCWRYIAPSSVHQSWSFYEPDEAGQCERFVLAPHRKVEKELGDKVRAG